MSKIMKNNSVSKALSKSLLAVLVLMILALANLAVSAQHCNIAPMTTVTEGNLFPGGIASFGVTSGVNSVTVDHVNAGTGLQSFTVVGVPTNATVNIPPHTPGTFNPVTATFTATDTTQPVGFTMRAASTYHAANIQVQCVPVPPPPPPPPAITGCTLTQGYWKNHEEEWAGPLRLGTLSYTEEQLLSIFREPVRGNGLISLAHQLIAAKLNIAAGASVPTNVRNAINAADALIGGNLVGGSGGGYLSPDLTSMLTAILDQYNNGNARGGPPHCDD
jgi:hypothetical protein